jgi:hypothetical protein
MFVAGRGYRLVPAFCQITVDLTGGPDKDDGFQVKVLNLMTYIKGVVF